MVDGVHGYVGHVAGHVVMEYAIVLDYVMILHLSVEGAIVLV